MDSPHATRSRQARCLNPMPNGSCVATGSRRYWSSSVMRSLSRGATTIRPDQRERRKVSAQLSTRRSRYGLPRVDLGWNARRVRSRELSLATARSAPAGDAQKAQPKGILEAAKHSPAAAAQRRADHRSLVQNGGGTRFPIEAAGTGARRLHNASRNSVDLSGPEWTPVEGSEGPKSQRGNHIASEVMRRQSVAESLDFEFDSRRLLTEKSRVAMAVGSLTLA